MQVFLYAQFFCPFPFSDFCIVNIQVRIIFNRERRKNSPSSEAFSSKCRNLVGGREHSAFMLWFPDSAKAITNWTLISWPLGPANPNCTVIWAHPDSSSGVETSQGRIIQKKPHPPSPWESPNLSDYDTCSPYILIWGIQKGGGCYLFSQLLDLWSCLPPSSQSPNFFFIPTFHFYLLEI